MIEICRTLAPKPNPPGLDLAAREYTTSTGVARHDRMRFSTLKLSLNNFTHRPAIFS